MRMFKSWLTTFLTAMAIVGSTTSFALHALSADKADRVFIDEGDGDFDSMPIPPPTQLQGVPKAAPTQVAVKPAPVVVKPVIAKSSKPMKSRGSSIAAKIVRKDPGVYVMTREACPMTREPASESARMITVKPAKKLWVEKVEGGKWFRAYNKAGEPGYIDGNCVTVQ